VRKIHVFDKVRIKLPLVIGRIFTVVEFLIVTHYLLQALLFLSLILF